MSDRPLLAPNLDKPIIFNQDMSTSFNGPATIIQKLPGISYDIIWAGTPTGSFSVQVTNTFRQAANGTITNSGNWNTLPSSAFTGTLPAPSGSADHGFIDVVGTEAYAVRLVYTASGGTGLCTVVAAAKVL
jgi:hypothetical protein